MNLNEDELLLFEKHHNACVCFASLNSQIEKNELISSMISLFEYNLELNRFAKVIVYNLAGQWLSKSDEIWNWLVARIKKADDKELMAISDGILQTLAEKPIDEYWRNKLLSLLLDKECWRAIGFAYEGFPEQLVEALMEYKDSDA